MSIRTLTRGLAAVALAGLAVAGAAGLARAEGKLGYINSDRIFAEYKGVEDAKKTFDQQVASWEKDRVTLRAELDSLGSGFKSQELMLTESMKKEKRDMIKAKESAYDEFVKSIWGPEGKIAQKNAELMKPIIDKVNVILDRIGTDEKFSMIFDAANGGVVFAPPGADLTPRVLEELNKGAQ